MILIADSGSTKTDWRLIDDQKKIHQYSTQGFNPYFQTEVEISEIIKSELLPQLKLICHLKFFFTVQVVEPILKKKLFTIH